MHTIFVYGTLKEGFANFGINAGRRLPGTFCTAERYPLFIIGKPFLPWLVHQPGAGEQVIGQLFEVDDKILQQMDRLEQVDEEGWYQRLEIQVLAVGQQNLSTRLTHLAPAETVTHPAALPLTAFAYFGSSARVAREPVHAGPLVEFTAQHNQNYLNAI